MPRRSRGHVYRKRTPASAEQIAAGPRVLEPAEDTLEIADLQSQPAVPPTQPASTFIRGRSAAATVPAVPAPRAQRALLTDYGYIVDEMQRIGLTFGGLIVLLVIVARYLTR